VMMVDPPRRKAVEDASWDRRTGLGGALS